MKIIPLTKGQFAMVDDADFESISQFKWYCVESTSTNKYARRDFGGRKNQRGIYMHQQILGRRFVDHKDGNGLNNCRENLRKYQRGSQNIAGKRMSKNNTSGFKGVSFHKKTGKWVSNAKKDKRAIYIGLFDTPRQAAIAYDKRVTKLFGRFARTNKMEGLLN